MGSKACLVITTSDSKEVADKIAELLVSSGSAACVQIDQVTSVFIWESKTTKQNEYRLMIKAATDNYQKIESIILDNHNYDLPQIIKINIDDALPAYLEWINQKT
jgi:periplasmic divalent cation tolerance protein